MFRGSVVALVTPFKSGKVDVVSLRGLVEHHISEGTHAIVAAGTTGEAGTLTREEKLLVIKTVVEQTRERIPVIAGTAANSTQDCIELTRMAMECGVHAALIMTPAYIKPTQEGQYQHYSRIAAAVPVPIILYNVPQRTACDLLPETVARLANISNIVGIKDATGNMTRLQQLLRGCGSGIDVFSGDDETGASWILAGAKGIISITANVAAKKMANMCDAAIDGEQSHCLRINEQLQSLHKLLCIETNPIPSKWALSKMGLIKDEMRLPLTSLSSPHHYALEHILHELNLC